MPSIVLRYFDGCPNWQTAKARLDEALLQLGLHIEVVLERIETPQQADALGLRGSPTIVIDGTDPFEGSAPGGLSCRLYRTNDGLERAPSVNQISEAVRHRMRPHRRA